jgi:hypothetical protein
MAARVCSRVAAGQWVNRTTAGIDSHVVERIEVVGSEWPQPKPVGDDRGVDDKRPTVVSRRHVHTLRRPGRAGFGHGAHSGRPGHRRDPVGRRRFIGPRCVGSVHRGHRHDQGRVCRPTRSETRRPPRTPSTRYDRPPATTYRNSLRHSARRKIMAALLAAGADRRSPLANRTAPAGDVPPLIATDGQGDAQPSR